LFSRTFWRDTAERALTTAAEALLALWVVAGDDFFNAFTVDYQGALGVALGAAMLSVLKSLAVARATKSGTASPVKAVEYLQ